MNLESIKEKKYFSSIFNDHDLIIIDEIKFPKKMVFFRADKFDQKYLMTNDDVWKIRYSGNFFKINFSSLDLYEKKLAKYILCYYVQINTPSKLRIIFYSFINFINYFKEEKLQLNFFNSKKFLIKLVENGSYYYETKFFIKILFLEKFSGFEINKEYELDLIERPINNPYLIYENKLDAITLPIVTMIQRGISKLIKDLGRNICVATEEIKQASILGLHYSTGLRPVQLSKLSAGDIKRETNSKDDSIDRYCITIPYAKQSRLIHEKVVVKLPEEIAKLILAYIDRLKLNSKDKLFDLGNTAAVYSLNAINDQLFKFSTEEYQKLVTNNELIPYKISFSDFRHHVGHSMALSGASAEEIAYILGHSSLIAAKYYIYSTPELAEIRSKALGKNALYQQMISMLLTGRLIYNKEWHGKKVAGNLANKFYFDIGGCAYTDKCFLQPIRNCYGCIYFHPFVDGNHSAVRDGIQKEITDLIKLSDDLGVKINPLILTHESTKFEIDSVISRCTHYEIEAI